MGEHLKNMLIGLFVIAAGALVVVMVMFLRPNVGDGKQTLYVRFANINKIGIGTRVMFGGKPVGEVVAVDPIPNARSKPSVDLLGQIYSYQLVLKIDSSVKVYDTDEFAIQTSGLLGEKSIAIVPKIPPKGISPKQISNQPVYAQSYDPIEYAFTELSEVADLMKVTIKEVNSWIKKHGDEMGKAVSAFGGAMEETRVAIHQMNASEAFANASSMLKHLSSASESIALGKGTLGKLILTDDMYLRANAILSKADTLMNDVNHYGLLFSQNKAWQRQRLQRVTALNALDSPQGFRLYFEKEVDLINTSMSRLSMLIEKANQAPEKEEIHNSELFRRDFAELLRQSQELSDNLRLYNQQLMQPAEK